MRLQFFFSLNTAIVYWIIILCYYKVALGIPQEVHRQNFGKHKHHKALIYEVSKVKAPVLYSGSKNLNYLKYKKREVSLINNELQTDFSNPVTEGAAVTEDMRGEMGHESVHFIFSSSSSTSQPYMSTQSSIQNSKIITDSENYKSSEKSSTYDVKMPLDDSASSFEHQDSVFMSCLETLCNNSKESTIVIYPERTAVLMGSNTSFTCILSTNSTQKGHVFWAPIKQYLGNITIGNNTVLYFENTKLSDSGIYKCVKWHHDNCCHLNVVLKVYSYPSYAKHLIIVGAVASIAFLMCVIVEIWRNFHLQQYSKSQEKTQEMEGLLFSK